MNEAARRGIVPTSFSFDPGDRRRPQRDHRRAVRRQRQGLRDPRGLPRQGGEARDRRRRRRSGCSTRASRRCKGPFQTGIKEMIAAIEALRAKSPGPHGVWKLPDGDAYYKSQIKFWTTEPDLTAEQIHQIGLDEVARIKGEMQAIMKQVGFQGDLPAFFKHLRTDPKNFFPNTPRGQAGLPRPVEGLHRLDLLGRQASTSTCCRRRRSKCARVEEWREDDGADRVLQPADAGRQPAGHLLREPARHDDAAEARDGDGRLPRGRAGPPLPDRDPAGARGRADLPEVRLLRRLRRGLGPLRRAPRQGRGPLHRPDAGLRPPAERDAARLPPRRRHRRPRQAVDARADDRVHDWRTTR